MTAQEIEDKLIEFLDEVKRKEVDITGYVFNLTKTDYNTFGKNEFKGVKIEMKGFGKILLVNSSKHLFIDLDNLKEWNNTK